jgi:predicted nucleotidyltransferase
MEKLEAVFGPPLMILPGRITMIAADWNAKHARFEPEETLSCWRVVKISFICSDEKTQHAVGWLSRAGASCITSAIQSFDPKTRCTRTQSGRSFFLQGIPGLKWETAWALTPWYRKHSVDHAVEVRTPYLLKPSEALAVHRNTIRQLIQPYHELNPRVFGPALKGTDDDENDLDILVEAPPGLSLLDLNLGDPQDKLEELLGVSVHLITPSDMLTDLPAKDAEQALAEAQPF